MSQLPLSCSLHHQTSDEFAWMQWALDRIGQ